MIVYLLLIVADLGPAMQHREYVKPVVAFSIADDCRHAVDFHTKTETKAFITYRCQEIQVVR